jgi:hypothetical protein
MKTNHYPSDGPELNDDDRSIAAQENLEYLDTMAGSGLKPAQRKGLHSASTWELT